jgi:hypothetical protein
MLGSVVSIWVMDSLVHHCIAAMILRVYGSLATQWISGGKSKIMQRELISEHFSWGVMLHTMMIGQPNRCQVVKSGEFSFGSILVAWFLERVPMLRLRVLLDASSVRETRLRWWVTILVRHGGGEGGHYFTTKISRVWWQMHACVLLFLSVVASLVHTFFPKIIFLSALACFQQAPNTDMWLVSIHLTFVSFVDIPSDRLEILPKIHCLCLSLHGLLLKCVYCLHYNLVVDQPCALCLVLFHICLGFLYLCSEFYYSLLEWFHLILVLLFLCLRSGDFFL